MSTRIWTRRPVNRREQVLSFVFTALAGLTLCVPGLRPSGDRLTALDRFSYDTLSLLRPTHQITDLLLIDMDLKAFQKWQPDRDSIDDWDRSLHARLLRKLTQDGAKVILFDVVFAKRTAADQDLADAMRSHVKVAIGAVLSLVERTG